MCSALTDTLLGAKVTVAHLCRHPNSEVIQHDKIVLLSVGVVDIFNMTRLASPTHYQSDPVQTTMASVMGAISILGLAKPMTARIFQTSISEVYGDPTMHPQNGRPVSNFIVQALQKEDYTIYGDRPRTRAFCSRSRIAHHSLPHDAPVRRCPDLRIRGEIIESERGQKRRNRIAISLGATRMCALRLSR